MLAPLTLTVAASPVFADPADPGSVTCGGASATLIGTSGDDTLKGTNGPDVIVGGAGNDTITGLGDTDVICPDEPDGAAPVDGDDVVNAGAGSDEIVDGAGNDSLNGGGAVAGGADSIHGGSGTDRIVDSGTGGANVYAGPGMSTISTNLSGDVNVYGAGSGPISAKAGGDVNVFDGAGDHAVSVTAGGEANVNAYGGTERVTVNAGSDVNIDTGSGDDTIRAGSHAGLNVDAGDGANVISDSDPDGTGNVNIRAGSGADTISTSPHSSSADVIVSPGDGDNKVSVGARQGDGNSIVETGTGKDTITGKPVDGSGQIVFEGGDGDDSISLPARTTGAGLTLALGQDGNDRLKISSGGGWLIGGLGEDTLLGGPGDDTLYGDDPPDPHDESSPHAGGKDVLYGGAGSDTLYGGGGDDELHAKDGVTDALFDCGDGTDKLTADVPQDSAVHRVDCGENAFQVTIADQAFTSLLPPTSVATYTWKPGDTAAQEWLTSEKGPTKDPMTGVPVYPPSGSTFVAGTAMKHQTAAVSFGPAQDTTLPTISVNPGEERQHVEGFGGAMTQSAAHLLTTGKFANKSAAQKKALAMLFGPSRAQFDYVRVPIGASDLSSTPYDFQSSASAPFSAARDESDLMPVLAQAKVNNPTIKLLATPWSAPGWMKNDTSSSTDFGVDCGEGYNPDHGPGNYLSQDKYQAYAAYLVEFLKHYRHDPTFPDLPPISMLSLQNEPHNCNTNFPTMLMEPADQAHLASDLRPLLDSNGFSDVGIMGWDHNWYEPVPGDHRKYPLDEETFYPQDVMKEADGSQGSVSAVGYHCYDAGDNETDTAAKSATDPTQNLTTVRTGVQSHFHDGTTGADGSSAEPGYPGTDVYFTECSGSLPYKDHPQNASANLVNEVRDDLIGPMQNWARTSLYWSLGLDENGGPTLTGGCPHCRGMLTLTPSSGSVVANEDYYYWEHFSKFVQRGAVVLGSTKEAGHVLAVAFRNPDDSMVVVALNTWAG